ncbi:MAG: hypothetical protein AAF597_08420, partial [Bacteroidota bacterium]
MRHFTLLFILLSCTCVRAQKIEAPRGYDTQVGNLVSMLEDLKNRVTRSVQNLSVEETDFLL